MSYYIQNEEKMMDIALDPKFNGQVIDLESLEGYIRFTDDGGEERDYSNYINTYSITFNSGKNNRIAINISSFNFEHSSTGTYLWDRLVITADDEIENLNNNFLNPEISPELSPFLWQTTGEPETAGSNKKISDFDGWTFPTSHEMIGNITNQWLEIKTRYIRFYFFSDSSIARSGWILDIAPMLLIDDDFIRPSINSLISNINTVNLSHGSQSQSVTFTADVTDNGTIDSVTLTPLAVLANNNGNIYIFTKTYSYSNYSYGTFTDRLTLTAIDRGNNVSTETIDITIIKTDTEPPNISSFSADKTTINLIKDSPSNVNYTVSCTDNVSINNIEIPGASLVSTNGNTSILSEIFDYNNYNFGSHSITKVVTVSDAEGNSATRSLNLTVIKTDTEAPNITSFIVNTNQVNLTKETSNQTVEFILNVTDNTSIESVAVSGITPHTITSSQSELLQNFSEIVEGYVLQNSSQDGTNELTSDFDIGNDPSPIVLGDGYKQFVDDGGLSSNYSTSHSRHITYDAGLHNYIYINIRSFEFEHTSYSMYDRLGITCSNSISGLSTSSGNLSTTTSSLSQHLYASSNSSPSSLWGTSFSENNGGWILPSSSGTDSKGKNNSGWINQWYKINTRYVRFYFKSDGSATEPGWDILVAREKFIEGVPAYAILPPPQNNSSQYVFGKVYDEQNYNSGSTYDNILVTATDIHNNISTASLTITITKTDYEMITSTYFIDITANLNKSIEKIGESLQLKSSIINKSDPNYNISYNLPATSEEGVKMNSGTISANNISNIAVGTFTSELILKIDSNGLMTSSVNIIGAVEPTLSVTDDPNLAQLVGWEGPNNTLPTPGPTDADILEATLTKADVRVLLQPQISQIEGLYSGEILDSWTARINEVPAVSLGSPPNILDQYASANNRLFPDIFIKNESIVLETSYDYGFNMVDVQGTTHTIIPSTKIYAVITHDPEAPILN
jgi:hypothetical protein